MSLNNCEYDLLQRLVDEKQAVKFPFTLTDDELDTVVKAIKRERGDAEKQARRRIRDEFASRHSLTRAMDGGFMQRTDKQWPYGLTLFGKAWNEYENLLLALEQDGIDTEYYRSKVTKKTLS